MSTAAPGGTVSSGSSRSTGSRAGSIVLLVLGIISSLIGLGMLAAGAALAAVNAAQSDDGFYTTPRTPFSVSSYALTSPSLEIAGDVWIPSTVPFDIATFRLQATAVDEGEEVFVGIAPRADVERYLASVAHSEVRELDYRPFRIEYRELGGTEAPEPPNAQDFWTQSASGQGTQEIIWQPEIGDWSVVVMNADASAGIDVELVGGVQTDLLWPVATGIIIGGSILFLLGVLLTVLGAIGLGRQSGGPHQPAPGTQPAAQTAAQPGVPPVSEFRGYPARLTGELDSPLSRGLWLVKWLLAIPHFIILAFLWLAFLITTIVAGFAVLFTGRYPRALFNFNVGVLRWNWRVSFYAYSALGTDRYPPFTLLHTPYPADFDVEYPERLSNGLVLVKWWLLALPHLLLVAVFAGGAWSWSWFSWSGFPWWASPGQEDFGTWRSGVSLLGLLVLIAGVMLLFTGFYQRPLFDLVMGINRWVYRVITYVSLMRDEYPPFRLDQGPDESPMHAASVIRPESG